jgi:hypothetical protein
MTLRSIPLGAAAAAAAMAAGTAAPAQDRAAEIAQNPRLSGSGAALSRTGVAHLLKP